MNNELPEPDQTDCDTKTLMVFGDLHGRILPAFRFAQRWSREHHLKLDAILQVGDLGYFPDITRLDKATINHAKDDPLELGAVDVVVPNPLADEILEGPDSPPTMWFTAGNHEDFDRLAELEGSNRREADFVVDSYCKVRAIKDGRCLSIAGCRVGAIWGVDREGRNARRKIPERAFIQERAINKLLAEPFDLLLSHDAPLGAKRAEYGSSLLESLIDLAQPRFAFFGHYSGIGAEVEKEFGKTRVFHMAGFELHQTKSGHAETGSVGILTWNGDESDFEYVPESWLKTFNRHNWKSG
jgi:Icc-related predicted phosphoesterase